jgi:formylmethanofuran dehydrogenase subunit E
MPTDLLSLLQLSAARHDHLCPRQVLGVRMGLAGLAALGLESPVTRQNALVIIETDGCFADGIEVATGATIGHRTLRINDLGKIAATFCDVKSGRAIRLFPTLDARERASFYAPPETRHYFAQLEGYKIMPDEALFQYQEVVLNPPLEALISRPGLRVACDVCGEEIINEREFMAGGDILCRACSGQGYYWLLPASIETPSMASLQRLTVP